MKKKSQRPARRGPPKKRTVPSILPRQKMSPDEARSLAQEMVALALFRGADGAVVAIFGPDEWSDLPAPPIPGESRRAIGWYGNAKQDGMHSWFVKLIRYLAMHFGVRPSDLEMPLSGGSEGSGGEGGGGGE